MNPQEGTRYLEEVLAIQQSNKPIVSKYLDLKRVIENLAFECTKNEALQFSNLFSKLSFICNTYKVSTKIHAFRATAKKVENHRYQPEELEYYTHLKYVTEFIASLYGVLTPAELMYFFPAKDYYSNKFIIKERIKKMRVQIIEIKTDCLICDYEEVEDGEPILVQIDEDGINEKFKSVKNFWVGAQLNLIHVTVDEESIYHPRFIILEPDYLINISSIAECFQDYGTSSLHYLKSKFEAVANTKPIRLGNFANQVVDHFTTEGTDKVDFNTIFTEDFKSNPLEFTTCQELQDPQKFREYHQEAKGHFDRLKRTIEEDFKTYDISLDRALLEPSFLCEQYGIQGRLDILDLTDDRKYKIIELKSGSAPYPDDGKKIKENHAVQLFLYYQIIGVLADLEFKEMANNTEGYIMYSKVYQGNLRYDKPNLSRVQTILDLRNQIIVQEHLLTMDDVQQTESLMNHINPGNLISKRNINQKFREILEQQISGFQYPIKTSTPLEKAYFFSFTNFIAKEQYLAQLGLGQSTSNNGLASLWLNNFDQKNKNFEIIYDLQIIDNAIHLEKKQIVLRRTNPKNDFISIREGDICVLYPRNNPQDTVLTNQIFKCTIQSITRETIVLQFRHKQPNTNFFDQLGPDSKWALERDFMDNSFTSMYRNIYAFIKSKKETKEVLLNQRAPEILFESNYHKDYLSTEQNRILRKALSARDYFLLNGPPGTGKTSIIIHELVKEMYANTTKDILLLAYTNRAVDELCESISTAIPDDVEHQFIRIGSELSCAPEHQHNILNVIIREKARELEAKGKKFSRATIDLIIRSQRVFVSTVASISNKADILKLKQFDTIIIDEASQILEPQIIGILPQAKRFIMIGDHKQLPAIVLQSPELAKTNHPLLEEIGLNNRKNSLFERLYTFCEQNNYQHAYDQLTYQGRMHFEIADFPNQHFYEGKLNVAYDLSHLQNEAKESLARQRATLNLKAFEENNPLQQILSTKRFAFLRVEENPYLPSTNVQEADLVVEMVKEIIRLYNFNSKPFAAQKTIGIIAPFRNQIALIKQKLELAGIKDFDRITVDTVERYQGSQRDIIIYSFAVTHYHQLNALINMNDEGTVDRKLNVALTRAKEQLFLIGNDQILKENTILKALCDYLEEKNSFKEIGLS